jgi:hypothetical protein
MGCHRRSAGNDDLRVLDDVDDPIVVPDSPRRIRGSTEDEGRSATGRPIIPPQAESGKRRHAVRGICDSSAVLTRASLSPRSAVLPSRRGLIPSIGAGYRCPTPSARTLRPDVRMPNAGSRRHITTAASPRSAATERPIWTAFLRPSRHTESVVSSLRLPTGSHAACWHLRQLRHHGPHQSVVLCADYRTLTRAKSPPHGVNVARWSTLCDALCAPGTALPGCNARHSDEESWVVQTNPLHSSYKPLLGTNAATR